MDTANTRIRELLSTEVSVLSEFAALTFRETYAPFNTEEDMQSYISNYFPPAAISEDLQDPHKQYFVSERNGDITGYCLLDTSRKPDITLTGSCIEISRIYVTKKWQGEKMGAALMQFCIDHAIANNFENIWLGVWQKNEKAISFYKKWGFEIRGSIDFTLGTDVQLDYIMVKELL